MKFEHFRPIRKPKPKRRGKIGKLRSRTVAQERKPITSPQLREAYSTKIEWAKKRIPRLEKETETPEEK